MVSCEHLHRKPKKDKNQNRIYSRRHLMSLTWQTLANPAISSSKALAVSSDKWHIKHTWPVVQIESSAGRSHISVTWMLNAWTETAVRDNRQRERARLGRTERINDRNRIYCLRWQTRGEKSFSVFFASLHALSMSFSLSRCSGKLNHITTKL